MTYNAKVIDLAALACARIHFEVNKFVA